MEENTFYEDNILLEEYNNLESILEDDSNSDYYINSLNELSSLNNKIDIIIIIILMHLIHNYIKKWFRGLENG